MTKFEKLMFALSNLRYSIKVTSGAYERGDLHLICLPHEEKIILFEDDRKIWDLEYTYKLDIDEIAWGPAVGGPDDEIHIFIPLRDSVKPFVIPSKK